MTFVQLDFCLFFAVVFSAYWCLPRRGQNLLLVAASAVFYGWIHPWFLWLLFGSAFLDYTMGRLMERFPERSRWFLLISLSGNLGMLGTFKYLDFFIENFLQLFDVLGLQTSAHTLGIFLPVGISFYTFQTMSYTIDIHRGKLQPRRNLLDYLVFVTFFPQLVAGPIERARRLLPQVEASRRFVPARIGSGLRLAVWGAFKKVCVADSIAPYVDKAFAVHEPGGLLLAAATLGFSLQILADFSGYTDIARGTARMLGFSLVENFRSPYLATNPSAFWQRWHISFSTWIRDYVYIAAGGSRGTFWFTTRNTFLAMMLSGLWHGASWNFVAWGAYHALLLTGYRLVSPLVPERFRATPGSHSLSVLLMFVFTLVGWALFRERDMAKLLDVLDRPLLGPIGETELVAAVTLVALTAVLAVPQLLGLVVIRWKLSERLPPGTWHVLRTGTVTLLALCVLTLVRTQAQDFIYFQF